MNSCHFCSAYSLVFENMKCKSEQRIHTNRGTDNEFKHSLASPNSVLLLSNSVSLLPNSFYLLSDYDIDFSFSPRVCVWLLITAQRLWERERENREITT